MLLLVWDQCGVEPIEFYEVDGDKIEALIIKCHGQYVNNSDLPDNAAVNKLSGMMWDEDGERVKIQGMRKINIENGKERGPYTRIVQAGFLP